MYHYDKPLKCEIYKYEWSDILTMEIITRYEFVANGYYLFNHSATGKVNDGEMVQRMFNYFNDEFKLIIEQYGALKYDPMFNKGSRTIARFTYTPDEVKKLVVYNKIKELERDFV